MNYLTILVVLIAALVVVGCGGVSQQEIDQNAMEFISGNVVFYAKNEEETVGFDQYKIADYESYRQGDTWVSVAHIEAELDGEQKQNDIILTFDLQGNVIKFNGKDVSSAR